MKNMLNSANTSLKKLLAVFAAGVLCVSAAVVPAAAQEETDPLSVLVTDMKKECYAYLDEYGYLYDFTYRIPQINLESAGADLVNREIETQFMPLFDQAEAYREERIQLSIFQSIDYECSLNGDLLSVVITHERTGAGVSDLYYAYNFRVTDVENLKGDPVSGLELALECEPDEEKLSGAVYLAIDEFYSTLDISEDPVIAQEMYKLTISQADPEVLSYYIDADGDLNAIFNYHTPDGLEVCAATAKVIKGVQPVLYGDVNGDSKVNVADRIVLTRYLAGWDSNKEIIERNSDVNNDGKVNVADRIVLTRHLAGWSDYSTLPYKK